MENSPLPEHYRATVRTLLRFAVVMLIVGLLSGVLFQESAKKLDVKALSPGLALASSLRLALVHGHVMVSAVLLPIACAGALLIARRIGGAELGTRPLAFLTRGYLPLICVTLGLMLTKAYHVLLAVRGGAVDMAAVDERWFFGARLVRHSVYGAAHLGLAIGIGVFAVALWRSLRRI